MNFAVKLASLFYIIKSNGNPQYHDISRSSTASLIIRTRLSKSTSHSTLDSWSISLSGWVDFVLCILSICFVFLSFCTCLSFGFMVYFLVRGGWLCAFCDCIFLFVLALNFFMVYFLIRVGWTSVLYLCIFLRVVRLDSWSISSSGWVDFVLCILSICFVFLSFCTCLSFGFMVYFLVRGGWLCAFCDCIFLFVLALNFFMVYFLIRL